MPAEQPNSPLAADAPQSGFDGGRIDGVGTHAFEAQKHGAIRAVPPARERQRPVQLCRQLRRALQQPAGVEQLNEAVGGIHRSHGVRTRGTNADLEYVEDAQTHARRPRPLDGFGSYAAGPMKAVVRATSKGMFAQVLEWRRKFLAV